MQLLLVILAIQTGFNLVIMFDRKGNGDGGYAYDDYYYPGKHYPEKPLAWYANYFCSVTVMYCVYILFLQYSSDIYIFLKL